MTILDPQSEVLDRYVRRGFEYEQTILAFKRYFSRTHDIVIAEAPTGIWMAQREGLRLGKWDTFHEMIIALMEQVVNVATP